MDFITVKLGTSPSLLVATVKELVPLEELIVSFKINSPVSN